MRIATVARVCSRLAGALVVLAASPAAAQQPPVEPTPQPTPMPVMPPIPATPEPPPPGGPPPTEPSPPPARDSRTSPEQPPRAESAPPPPGQTTQAPEPPPPMPPLPLLEPAANEAGPPRAGWHDGFFLRDEDDLFRLYPHGRIQLDFHSFFGPGVSDVPAAGGGNALESRFFVRRLKLELGGEVMRRFQFLLGAELGGQPIANSSGGAQTSAAPAGVDPTAETARFVPVQTPQASAALDDAWINYRICPCLNFMFGQQRTPFSIEARTSTDFLTRPERSLAVRSFAVPSPREIGLTIWGELGALGLVSYEIGVFGGDGQNRPQVDNRVDFIGRVFVRPLVGGQSSTSKLQIGVSARHGQRDPDYAGYDHPAITTGQGVVLWRPEYADTLGRTIHVLPSGAQNAIGGELRLPFGTVDLRGEAYWVSNATRESVEGTQLTNTERLGRLMGLGWYAQISAWPVGDAFVTGDPGFVRPQHLDLSKDVPVKKGLEVWAVVGGIHATYDGDARQAGQFEPTTPGVGGSASDIVVLEYGAGVTYWYTRHVRATLAWTTYHTPGSSSTDNLAVVPGNVANPPRRDAHVLHELGARLGSSF